MPKSSRQDLMRRDHSVLSYIWEQTDQKTGFASVSRKTLAEHLNSSDYQVGYTLSRLQNQGSIIIEERRLKNGGRLENAYALTEAGAKQLLRLTSLAS